MAVLLDSEMSKIRALSLNLFKASNFSLFGLLYFHLSLQKYRNGSRFLKSTTLFSDAKKTLPKPAQLRVKQFDENAQLFRDISQPWFEFVLFYVLRSMPCISRLQHQKCHNRRMKIF